MSTNLTLTPVLSQQESQVLVKKGLTKQVVSDQLPLSGIKDVDFCEMCSFLDNDICIPLANTTKNRNIVMEDDHRIKVLSLIKSSSGIISFTANAQSSKVYKRHMAVIIHQIDCNWNLTYTFLEFKRFKTPQNREPACSFLFNAVQD